MKWTTAAAGVFALAVLIGCGGEPSVASKSAAAFEEAQKEGKTFEGAGHDHGDHGAAEPAPAQGGEHQHGTAPEADHSAMGHGGGHPAEGHATAQHGGHAAPSAGNEHTGHSQPTAQGGHEGHNQPAPQATAPGQGHAGHSQPAAQGHEGHNPPAPQPAAPGQGHSGHAPSSAVAELPAEPASILRPDTLDAPAATSVADAQRSAEMNQAMSGGHGASTYRHVDAGRGPEAHEGSEPQTPGAGPQQHDHGAAAGESAAVYVCPMHPEVTSNAPGTCSKCGMALVERRDE
ncbi:MAG TPA: heavy metal-binding domain-containing protein [Thermoanaerobaculia bacterium]